MDVDQLNESLARHLTQVRAAAEDNEFVDLARAEELHALLSDALNDWTSYTVDQRKTLTEAVEYLVRTDDEEDDLRSPIGFDDDAEVVEAALTRVRG